MFAAEILEAEGLGAGSAGGPLVVQCSSLGRLSANYLAALRAALGGERMELVWPSAESVRAGRLGWAAGGSLCLNAKAVDAPMRQLMRCKYEGLPVSSSSCCFLFCLQQFAQERAGVSPHIKTLWRMAAGAGRELRWLYVGSANLSKSAWGEVQQPASGGPPQLRVASFEIGVLFVPRLVSRCAGRPVRLLLGEGNERDRPAAGDIVLPVPFRYPCEQYSATLSGQERLDDMPWTWDVAYQQRDSQGQHWHGIHSKH